MNRYVNCPHCNILIEVLQLNCKIFRCGIYKNTFQQIDPHLPKKVCDELKSKDLIYGCGKPFFVNENYESIVCDYI